MKQLLIDFLMKNIKSEGFDIEKLLEVPKLEVQGDFSLPMFMLAKELKKAPPIIAKEFEEKLSQKLPNFLEKVVAIGPYLNFYLNNIELAKEVIESISNGSILKISLPKKQKVLIEYPSPNTNKALHLGHVRNILIGNSLSNVLKKTGNEVIRTNLNNDRGIALCKSMLGYQLFYHDKTPKDLEVKPDEFISICYVRFEQEANKDSALNDDAQKMLVEWEEGNTKVRKLWQKILDMVYLGYEETYKNFKLGNFNKQYHESQIYDKGKDIVVDALKRKVNGFGTEDDGAVFCDLSDIKLDKKYLLRSDGTTLYMTQDLYLAYLKEKEFKADRYVFIVGKEQQYHFNVLFEILDRMGFAGTGKNFHFAYGYVYDKDGKKFSSRKGKVIGANWLYHEIINAAKEGLLSKDLTKNLSRKEIEARAKIIGYGALAFSFLKINPLDDIKFDLNKALSFEGETGPYIQYTYARIKSVLNKADYKSNLNINYDLFSEREISLIKTLKQYPVVVLEAAERYKLSAIANYLIKVCQQFNEFYQNCPIIKEQEDIKNARLLLSQATSLILKDGLSLLDIEVLEEM